MAPRDEIKDENITSSLVNINAKNIIRDVVSSFDELEDVKIKFYQTDLTIKKIRKKNTNLIPKKKKRKK